MAPEWKQAVLRMHPRAEPELKTPMGTLYKGPEEAPDIAMLAALEELNTSELILIAVGDVTVATLLALDVVPDMAFVDGQTKRQALEEEEQVDLTAFHHVLHAENPPGVLTPSLQLAVAEAAALEQPVVVVVDGEEDLAPLLSTCTFHCTPWSCTVSPVPAWWFSPAALRPRCDAVASSNCLRWNE